MYTGKKIAGCPISGGQKTDCALIGRLFKVYNVMRCPKAAIETKRNLFNEYVLLVMTYGNEKWVLNTLLQRL